MKKLVIFIAVMLVLYLIEQELTLTTTAAVTQGPDVYNHHSHLFYEISQWIEWRVIYVFDVIIRVVGSWF
ncbi:hypothetical protein HMI01_07120 [Halolactibacillus miurensis]|uniref:Uncharacterized protein n=1 Tax=Halolactibacillus miurensis TaxID=306541 RepID=A0A1I6PNT0_9BACI|nr:MULTISPECIES: hypothetical protein [Halolactibacillus]GEM03724.1 hypothetical protein HMI01_07120 [Halolactibacillus miurensis]SFS41856.1 hypothetical protein SAMN05421668_102105 [Halolactibacillus miurensis]